MIRLSDGTAGTTGGPGHTLTARRTLILEMWGIVTDVLVSSRDSQVLVYLVLAVIECVNANRKSSMKRGNVK